MWKFKPKEMFWILFECDHFYQTVLLNSFYYPLVSSIAQERNFSLTFETRNRFLQRQSKRIPRFDKTIRSPRLSFQTRCDIFSKLFLTPIKIKKNPPSQTKVFPYNLLPFCRLWKLKVSNRALKTQKQRFSHLKSNWTP